MFQGRAVKLAGMPAECHLRVLSYCFYCYPEGHSAKICNVYKCAFIALNVRVIRNGALALCGSDSTPKFVQCRFGFFKSQKNLTQTKDSNKITALGYMETLFNAFYISKVTCFQQ